MDLKSLFEGRTVVIATMHGKEAVMAPLLEQRLGLKVLTSPALDTDIFGTFSGELERTGSQVDAARAKVEKAMELTGADLAIASEGSFNPHHVYFFATGNYELVLLRDKKNNMEWQGWSVSMDVQAGSRAFFSTGEAVRVAYDFGFPGHGVIVKVPAKHKGFLYLKKGITSANELEKAAGEALRFASAEQAAVLENDLRAFHNPTRMEAIRQATLNLLDRLDHSCPACTWPGFATEEKIKGLPCSLCGSPTDLVLYEVHHCNKCDFRMEKLREDGLENADPMYCPSCNP